MILKTFPDKVKPSSKIYQYINKNVIDKTGVYWSHQSLSRKDFTNKCSANRGMWNVLKSNVALKWEEATGYNFLINPREPGKAVQKSELQYKHDGIVVDCPIDPNPMCCYQKFIDSSVSETHFSELRVFYHWGVDFIFEKIKPKTDQWGWKGDEVNYFEPLEIFTQKEIDQINLFADLVGLDFGEIDIMRDSDGKLYAIDINNISGNGSRVFDKFPKAEQRYIKAVKKLCEL